MPELRRKLLPSEINYGILMLTGLPRDLLPHPAHKVVVIDVDGEEFQAKMHSTQLRVDGLTRLHRKHRTFKGQAVTIWLEPSKPGVVNVGFGGLFKNTESSTSQILTNKSIDIYRKGVKESTEVDVAFDIFMEEIENVIAALNHEGSKAFEGGKYKIARDLIEKGSQMTAYRDKVKELQREWSNMFNLSTSVFTQESKKKTSRFRKLQHGLRTPEDEFRIPILQSIVRLGGSAPLNEVLESVERLMKDRLNPYDRQPIQSDPEVPRWRNTAQWARATMVKEGLLSSESQRGIWEITEMGKNYLNKFS